MLKILPLNRSLPDGKRFYLFSILILSSLKDLKIIFLTSSLVNSYRKMALNTRSHKNKEIIYEPERKKGYIQKPLKVEEDSENKVIDTMTRSLYVDKSFKHLLILQTQDEESSLDDLVIKYLPEGYFHIPTIMGKTQKYYKKILSETGSIKVQHIYRGPKSRQEFTFSKISIEKILSLNDWSHDKNPNRFRKFFDTLSWT